MSPGDMDAFQHPNPPEQESDFQFGNRALNERGFRCCGKPVGCTMTHEGCAHLRHPWKRAMVFGEPNTPEPINPGGCNCSPDWRKPKPNGTCATCGLWLPGERPPSLVAMWRGESDFDPNTPEQED